MRKFNQLLMYKASSKPDIILKFDSLDSAQNTFMIPAGYNVMDVFLVNGGNAGEDGTSGSDARSGYQGKGGNSLIKGDISVQFGEIYSITVGNGGLSNGARGGTTQLNKGTTVIYSPLHQEANAKEDVKNGVSAPDWVNQFEGNQNLYGASGGKASSSLSDAGTTGGGSGAYYYANIQTGGPSSAGYFYGAGGGAGFSPDSYPQWSKGSAGYQGVAFIRIRP